jgi:predicted AlkP superfamily phosphohydrolase/phosphomutase
LTHLIEQHIAEGHLPTFKKLFDSGVVAENCLTNYPTITPPGWATIATGALAGTHGVTDFTIHQAGTSPAGPCTAAFSSQNVHAEFIWDAADKAGKKSIVLNYPGSWPSSMKNGIMVGGSGLSVGEYRDGLIGLGAKVSVCHDQIISTESYPNGIRGELVEADGWVNVDEPGDDPLEMTVQLNFPMAKDPLAPTTWHLLVRDMADEDYDTVTLSPTRNLKDAFCTLKTGDWSQKVLTRIQKADGTETEVFFQCKLTEIGEDSLTLYLSAFIAISGWSDPEDIAAELSQCRGVPFPGGGVRALAVGWIDLDTYVEVNELYSQWQSDAANILLDNHDWDLFYMHSHPTDWVYHAIISDMDPETQPDEKIRRNAWKAHLGIYQSQDRMLAAILESLDEETLVILISDHGATPDGPKINPYDILVPAGLSALGDQLSDDDLVTWMKTNTGIDPRKTEASIYSLKTIRQQATVPDVSRSKALPQRACYVYVNLKGRDPGGIVEPEDYTTVQRQIIGALLNYVEPTSGKRPIALALSKQDARILGLYGDWIGDVVYAVYPEFGSQHGQILPTATHGIGSLHGLFVLNGPGIKKGHRLQRTTWLTDIVPTICHASGLPLPAQAEGAVVYQAFEDPDFKQNEINRLREALNAQK